MSNLTQLLLNGGAITWVLLGVSIISLTFILERAFCLRQAGKRQVKFQQALREHLAFGAEQRSLKDFLNVYLASNPYPFADLITNLCRMQHGRSEGAEVFNAETILNLSIQREAKQLERGLGIIGTIASIAPLLGLLGTVLGMIQAFMGSGTETQTSVIGEEVTAGLSQALVTTALGLVVAIPGIIFHNAFSKKIDALVSNLEACGVEIASSLTKNTASKPKQQDHP